MINWEKLNMDDVQIISEICDRAVTLIPQLNKMDLSMDICAVHVSGCPLNLDRFREFDNFNFAHDIAGIMRHIDRSTGELTNCFIPRCAR